MLTVLFVLFVLFGFGKLLSVLDGQRASSSEVGSYLRAEYNVNLGRPTMAQLRNI